MKKSFVLYIDNYEPIRTFTLEQKGMMLDAIFKFHTGEKIGFTDNEVERCFLWFKQSFLRDHEKYLKICERNKRNGKKGGRPKEPKKPSGYSGNPKNHDNDNGSVNENVNENKQDLKKVVSLTTKSFN